MALHVGRRTFPTYSCRCSRHTFTQPQLFACLVLKAFFKADYRRIVAYLEDMPGLREQLGLKKTPHFTTLQKASARLLNDKGDRKVKRLITHTLYAYHDDAPEADPPPERPSPAYVFDLAAVDSTGFDAGRASRYFVRRRRSKLLDLQEETHYKRFAKLGIIAAPESVTRT